MGVTTQFVLVLSDICVAYMDVGEGREQDAVALKVLFDVYKLRVFASNLNNMSTI